VLRTDLPRIVGILVALSLVPPAYAADKFPDYPARPASDYAIKTEKAGVTIEVQPIEGLKEQKTYFHTELSPKGFVPVFVVIQNESNGDSFLFDKTSITYGPADSSVSTPEARSKAGERIAIVSFAALSVTGALIAIKLISNASWVQENILKKELQSKTLSAGTSTHGFLYVPVLTNTPRQKITLRVPVTRTGTDETFVLELVF
jgi:hypothetical protein